MILHNYVIYVQSYPPPLLENLPPKGMVMQGDYIYYPLFQELNPSKSHLGALG